MTEPERARLGAWLAGRFGAGVRMAALVPLGGGAIQENWGLDLELPDGALLALVLRRDAAARLPASLDRAAEYRVIETAFAAGVKVAEPLGLCTDPTVLGGPFSLARRVQGITNPRRLTGRDAPIADGDALARDLGRELARIHSLRPAGAALGFPPPPGEPPVVARLAHLATMLDALSAPQPVLEWMLIRLAALAPPPLPAVLLHGDYRTGNLMIEHGGRIAAVLDWEFAAWGDPLEDIGWFCAPCWRFLAPEREAGGIGARAAFYAGYAEVAGAPVPAERIGFWEAFATVRWAIIAVLQGERHRSEEAPVLEAALTGRMAPQIAHQALTLVRALEAAVA
ncbi:MAG: phosphotransferase family protein [Acetobacteraceae bacterium]